MDCCCYNSSKSSLKTIKTRLHFSTDCVDSAILLPLTVINTNITMVISKNQLLLRDTQKHCNFWACRIKHGSEQTLSFVKTFGLSAVPDLGGGPSQNSGISFKKFFFLHC